MQLEFLPRWKGSGTGNCPALHGAADDNYVTQGWQLGASTLANLGDDETAVEVPADVIAGISAGVA
jgi:hypothetical protein